MKNIAITLDETNLSATMILREGDEESVRCDFAALAGGKIEWIAQTPERRQIYGIEVRDGESGWAQITSLVRDIFDKWSAGDISFH